MVNISTLKITFKIIYKVKFLYSFSHRVAVYFLNIFQIFWIFEYLNILYNPSKWHWTQSFMIIGTYYFCVHCIILWISVCHMPLSCLQLPATLRIRDVRSVLYSQPLWAPVGWCIWDLYRVSPSHIWSSILVLTSVFPSVTAFFKEPYLFTMCPK